MDAVSKQPNTLALLGVSRSTAYFTDPLMMLIFLSQTNHLRTLLQARATLLAALSPASPKCHLACVPTRARSTPTAIMAVNVRPLSRPPCHPHPLRRRHRLRVVLAGQQDEITTCLGEGIRLRCRNRLNFLTVSGALL